MQTNLIRVLMDGNDYVVDATYQPADPGDRDCPPTPEGFDIGEIYWSDGKTPVALTDNQLDRLERLLLKECHAEREYNEFMDHEGN